MTRTLVVQKTAQNQPKLLGFGQNGRNVSKMDKKILENSQKSHTWCHPFTGGIGRPQRISMTGLDEY